MRNILVLILFAICIAIIGLPIYLGYNYSWWWLFAEIPAIFIDLFLFFAGIWHIDKISLQ